MAEEVEQVLKERKSRYGEYHENAAVTWELMQVFMKQAQWWSLTPAVQHGIYMTQHKLARAICGDADYEDNWVDVSGYAECVLADIRRRRALDRTAGLPNAFDHSLSNYLSGDPPLSGPGTPEDGGHYERQDADN